MTPFEEIVQELSVQLDLPIQIEEKERFQLFIERSIEVHIELSEDTLSIRTAASLAELPQDTFREKVMINALKQNNQGNKEAIFAFTNTKNYLILCNETSIQGLNGEKFADMLERFAKKALLWKGGIDMGNADPEGMEDGGSDLPPPFSIR